jgi:hypothetical protein
MASSFLPSFIFFLFLNSKHAGHGGFFFFKETHLGFFRINF